MIAVRDRLAACGYAAVDDGVRVELVVLPYVTEAVARLSELEVTVELSREALEVLLIVGHLSKRWADVGLPSCPTDGAALTLDGGREHGKCAGLHALPAAAVRG